MRLRGHRAADYACGIEALSLAIAIELALRLTSVATILEWLNRLQPVSSSRSRRTSYSPERFAAAAYRLLPVPATCLRVSLIAYGLLRRRGAAPRLCVGVKKDGGFVSAHAWVEYAGTTPEPSSFLELR